jgi:hypothetical protein
MISVRTFTSESFKRTLHDNTQLVVPSSKILAIEEASIENCFQAEWDMACNVNLMQIIGTLFRRTIGEGQGDVNFGTLGVFTLFVSPEERKWSIVASEPIYISLNEEITYPVEIKEILKKMIVEMMPRTITIRSNERLLIKDLRINIENKPDGTPTEQTEKTYITAICAIFDSVVFSLSQEERRVLTREGRFIPSLIFTGGRPSMIRQLSGGTRVSFFDDSFIEVFTRPRFQERFG